MKWYITIEDYSYNRAYLLNSIAYSGEADIDFTNHSVHAYSRGCWLSYLMLF